MVSQFGSLGYTIMGKTVVEIVNWWVFVKRDPTSSQLKSNQITFIVTSPQHKCLGE